LPEAGGLGQRWVSPPFFSWRTTLAWQEPAGVLAKLEVSARGEAGGEAHRLGLDAA
jgi:hypothetical protein